MSFSCPFRRGFAPGLLWQLPLSLWWPHVSSDIEASAAVRGLPGSMQSSAHLAPRAAGSGRRCTGPLFLPRQEPTSKDRQPGYNPSHECLELSPGLDFSFNQERETKQNKTKHPTVHTGVVLSSESWKHLSRIYNLSFPGCRLGGLLWLTPRELPITPSDQYNMECSTAVYSFKII